VQYFAIYKPFGYLSQFTPDVEGQLTLKDLYDFPAHVYPVGRLDKDSEGLLILTDDPSLNQALLQPSGKKIKTYLAQVEGDPMEADLDLMRKGMTLRIRKKDFISKPAIVRKILPPAVEQRTPPIRFRKSQPDSWIELSISEGKYHQVRKMCAHIGHPVLRLIRVKIADYSLPSFEIGRVWSLANRRLIVNA
jgi:23S rRNA pseudouridine2457 synthase